MSFGLLIGHDTKRLKVIFEMLSSVGWKLSVTTQPMQLAAIVAQKEYQAFFCDEDLKGASIAGIQAIIFRADPDAPFYVFRDLSTGKVLRTPKPITKELAFPPIKSHLPVPQVAKVWEEPQEGLSATPSAPRKLALDPSKTMVSLESNVELISVTDIIQSMCMDKREGVIELDKGKTGLIYIQKGLIEHALFFEGGQVIQGTKALGRLLAINDQNFRIVEYKLPGSKSIGQPAHMALTEASRLSDEAIKYQKIMISMRQICPSITAIAIGYPMSAKANQGYGEYPELFQTAKNLLEKSRESVKGRINELFISTDTLAYSLTHLDEGNLLIASAPAKDRVRLQEALKSMSVASYA